MSESTPAPETTTSRSRDVVMQFLTQGGAVVDLYRHEWTEHHYAAPGRPAKDIDRTGFQWECTGCDAFGGPGTFTYEKYKGYEEREPGRSRAEANAHAETCRSMPRFTA
ncbi:hypothetical protein [Streptomyces sp. NPDC007063]|uniref:hypothetical protein n=1 Tax=Streptomyces sp. NPDC007063 TaxID=3364772 RepID=UPI0036984F66